MRQLFSAVLLLFLSVNSALAHEGENIVHISKNGFEPNTLTIDVGEIVIFENTDTVGHWPASDIHPSHGIYPELDPKRDLKPGESWEFTFDKAGEWTMHDHSFPTLLATVKVEGDQAKPQEPAKSIITRLKQNIKLSFYKLFKSYSDNKFSKVDVFELIHDQDNLSFWLNVRGSKNLMTKLLEQSEGGTSRDCHQEAHVLGRSAFESDGKDAFASGDLSCHSGFYHGAMEGFLKINGTTNLAQNISDICQGFETSFGKFECLHGVGHGLMAYKNYDLPEALKACDLLLETFDQTSCYGGVFMENIIIGQVQSIDGVHHTKWLSDDPHFPCNALDPGNNTLQFQCYMMQTSRMLNIYSYDYQKVIEQCSLAVAPMIPVCFQSLGRDIAGNVLRNPSEIVKNCNLVPETYRQNCFLGSLNVIVDFWGDKMEGYPHALCNLLSGNEQEICFRNLSTRLKDVYGSDNAKISTSCKLMGKFEESCKQIAR